MSISRGPSRSIPEASLRRLPLYHRYLKSVRAPDRRFVSCPEIAAELRLDPTQVRKDLEAAAIQGRPKVGYVLDELVREIEHFLGWDNARDAFLVGAGSLGRALMGYTKFQECGLQIVAAFDADLTKIGTTVHGRSVFPLDRLSDLAQSMHVRIGIITVPSGAAQGVAERMVEGGMRAIWNFAPVRLRVPEPIIVHNEDLYCSLASLSQKLGAALAEERRQRYRASLLEMRDDVAAAAASAGETADPAGSAAALCMARDGADLPHTD
jgi:redox-sensing transcriptional repressor